MFSLSDVVSGFRISRRIKCQEFGPTAKILQPASRRDMRSDTHRSSKESNCACNNEKQNFVAGVFMLCQASIPSQNSITVPEEGVGKEIFKHYQN